MDVVGAVWFRFAPRSGIGGRSCGRAAGLVGGVVLAALAGVDGPWPPPRLVQSQPVPRDRKRQQWPFDRSPIDFDEIVDAPRLSESARTSAAHWYAPSPNGEVDLLPYVRASGGSGRSTPGSWWRCTLRTGREVGASWCEGSTSRCANRRSSTRHRQALLLTRAPTSAADASASLTDCG